jgi:hypothetical protein
MNLRLLVESCQLLVGGVRVHLVFLVGFFFGARGCCGSASGGGSISCGLLTTGGGWLASMLGWPPPSVDLAE